MSFFTRKEFACNREDGVNLGLWLEQMGMFHHVQDIHHFQDSDFLYRFYNDERDLNDSSCHSPQAVLSPVRPSSTRLKATSQSPAAMSPSSILSPKSPVCFSTFEMNQLYTCLQTLQNELVCIPTCFTCNLVVLELGGVSPPPLPGFFLCTCPPGMPWLWKPMAIVNLLMF